MVYRPTLCPSSALTDLLSIPVLDAFLPTFSVSVYYPKTQSHVKLGNTLLPSAVSSSPNVLIHQLSSSEKLTSTPTIRANVTYTLALTDPDATSHADPVKGEMCHWIVTGMSLPKSSSDQTVLIPSSHVGFRNIDLNNQDISISNVTELISYLPPSPPPKTGFHRYVFVMLASAASDDRHIEQGLKKPKERPHWGYGKVGKGVRRWAKENGLVVVGECSLMQMIKFPVILTFK